MGLQTEFYIHILSGAAGRGDRALARMALRMGGGWEEPFDVAELGKIKRYARESQHAGLSELFACEYIRSCVIGGAVPWTEDERRHLLRIANRPNSAAPPLSEPD